MKRSLFIFILLAFAASAHAQGVRVTRQLPQEGTIANVTNALLVPANPVVKFCLAPANAVPCTNLAVTYTDSTLVTPCAGATQIVLDATTSCVALPDAQSNWGVWVAPGQYTYTVTIAGANLGPYYVTAGGSGPVIDRVISSVNFSAQSASIGDTVLYAVPLAGAGMYRASCWTIVTRAATTTSTLPTCHLNWSDQSGVAAFGLDIADANSANILGTHGNTPSVAGLFPTPITFAAAASTNIRYSTVGYASSGATSMQYDVHIRLEYLGP